MREDLVKVASFLNPYEANLAAGMLEANGIECVVRDDVTVTMNWAYSNAIGGVKVYVINEDAEDATRLLQTEQSAGSDQNNTCPNCGSGDIARPRISVLFGLFTTLFMVPSGLTLQPFGYKPNRVKCKNCRYIWWPGDESMPGDDDAG